ncbi:3816_t:CDS:2 [Paraglomus occultum]|uniref:3816_t:CDS:1 n=1 Tax=Paraglomus occultum TaxID=144539 RepID=A0A9N9B1F7_9GLOM|nr:3816_t:CDS:2 [Paraglomus occultum]
MSVSMNYEDTGTYTGDSFSEDAHHGSVNTTSGQLNSHRHDQVETHTNNFCPIPAFFQTLRGPSVPYSAASDDSTNNSQFVCDPTLDGSRSTSQSANPVSYSRFPTFRLYEYYEL